MKIEPFKMEVTPDQSRQVQEIVFRNGGKWMDGSKEVTHLDAAFLFYDSRERLQKTSQENKKHFDNDRPEPQITFADFMARYGGAETTQFDTMRKIVTIAEDAHDNGYIVLCSVLLDALADYVINNRP